MVTLLLWWPRMCYNSWCSNRMIHLARRLWWRLIHTAASRAGLRSNGGSMTVQETAALVGALVGLFGAIQAWLVGRSINHGNQLNGLMAPRIAAGAAAVVVADQQGQAGPPAAASAITGASRTQA